MVVEFSLASYLDLLSISAFKVEFTASKHSNKSGESSRKPGGFIPGGVQMSARRVPTAAERSQRILPIPPSYSAIAADLVSLLDHERIFCYIGGCDHGCHLCL